MAFPFPSRKKSVKFVSACTSIWRREPCVSVPVCGRSVFGANASGQGLIFGSSPREDVESRRRQLHVSASVQRSRKKERWGAYMAIFERPRPRLSPRCFHKDAPALHPPYLSRHLPMRCTVSSRSGTYTLHTFASRHGLSEFFFFRDEIPQCSTIVSKNSKLAQTSKHTLHASGENGGISVRSTAGLFKGGIRIGTTNARLARLKYREDTYT